MRYLFGILCAACLCFMLGISDVSAQNEAVGPPRQPAAQPITPPALPPNLPPQISSQQGQVPTPKTAYKVTHTYPHDNRAFTQGLLFHDGVLYEGTGQYNESRIRRVEIETGRVLKEWPYPNQLFGEGLTLFGDYLLAISWRSGVGLVLERESLKLRAQFNYKGQGWGLTDDERFIYMTNGSSKIFVRDPRNFEIVRTINVTDQGRAIVKLNELEWIEGEIWANVWKENRIARIDPQTGRVKSWLILGDLARKTKGANLVNNVLNGIAYDPKTQRVFVTGKYWPNMYELEIADLKQ